MGKFYSCSFAKSGLHFTPEHMKFCCTNVFGPYVNINKDNYDNVLNSLFEKRKEILVDMQNHILPKECQNCVALKEHDSDEASVSQDVLNDKIQFHKINSIIINHFKQCDCFCIYCSQYNYQKKIITTPVNSEFYDLLPIIKSLYNQDKIDKNDLYVEFQGGSIGVLKEFPELVELFLKNHAKRFVFCSNGIKFSPEIVKATQTADCLLNCSIDSGSPEVFKKLKSIDRYYQVIENLKRYKNEAPSINLSAKYILVTDVNDNQEELEKFLNAAADIGADYVQTDIDFRNIICNKGVRYDVPEKYYALFDFFKKRSDELGLKYIIWDYVQSILDKGFFE